MIQRFILKLKHRCFEKENKLDWEDVGSHNPLVVEGSIYKDSVKSQSDTVNFESLIVEPTDSSLPSIEIPALAVGLNHKSIPSSANKNTRQWITSFYNVFNEGDYITGYEMGQFYKHNQQMNGIVRSAVSSFFNKNIHRITKKGNRLVLHTSSPDGAHMGVKIPLLVSFSFHVADNSSIVFDDTFKSKEDKFKNWPMLPIEFEGIDIVQKKDTVPHKGYINNNSFFVNYPESTLNYKFKK